MMNETTVTLVGNLTADPELRFTSSGTAVANFTVATTPRTFDRASGEWKDAEALFLRCTLWRQPAEHLAESLRRGDRVIVVGRLKQRSFETRDGDKRTVIECDATEVGASLQFRQAKLTAPAHTGAPATGDSQLGDDEPPF
ncbi:MAG: single-stranded DNA-binding protein [Actinobacteria bacterium]|nr:single-stranded DNA-binding protein [Actinomycetota bacterium]